MHGTRGAKAVLDHVAVGTRTLADGWQLFAALLGGTWAYGGDSPGFWWGQMEFAAGPKIELITPTAGPDAGFLERFLDSRGAGPHHLNFIVPHIEQTLARVSALGIEPVQVSLQNPAWKEAFVHPRDGFGVVIQLAEQSGLPPELPPPAGFALPGPASAFALVEHYVADIERAARLFTAALDAEIAGKPGGAAAPAVDLTWQNGARLRLMQAPAAGAGLRHSRRTGVGSLHFTRRQRPFAAEDLSVAAELSERLGVSLHLGS